MDDCSGSEPALNGKVHSDDFISNSFKLPKELIQEKDGLELFSEQKQQRHILRAIPFTKATYSRKNKEGEFYVYGLQKEVYFEGYPQQCSCCICR
ncbi:protein SSUH2 [Caerostris extrusa]|uniref:Protein SSUH2 n=1 Tax=Caerostris extrusa TaxID=172846 RepID=A0AAV4M594_CAEEX|nr:protein SSUH2 [Caerostris extrusa]